MSNSFRPSTGPAQGGANPIQRVVWTLANWELVEREFDKGLPTARKTSSVKFNFINVKVKESTIPYVFPIASVTIPYSNPATDRGQTRWAVWSTSGRNVLGSIFELDDLVGKEQEWAQLPGKLRVSFDNLSDEEQDAARAATLAKLPEDVDADVKQVALSKAEAGWYDSMVPCFQIVSIGGQSAGGANTSPANDIMGYLAKQAEGRKDDDYYIALVADQKVTSNASLIQDIVDRKLVGKLQALGLVSVDPDGTMHAVASAG